MNKVISLSMFLFVFQLMVYSTSEAQSLVPFAGRGMTDKEPPAPSWFGAGGAATKESKEVPRWFNGQNVLRPARPNEMEERPKLLGGFFQRPEPNEPTLVQRANERSRDFWDRTRDWTHERNEAIKNRTNETWEALTRGLRPADSEPEAMPAPYGGPVRMAEKPDESVTDRF